MYEILDALPLWQRTLLGTLLGCCIGLWLCKLGDATLAYVDKSTKKAKLKKDYSRLMYGGAGMRCSVMLSNFSRYSLLPLGCKGDTILLKERGRLSQMKDSDFFKNRKVVFERLSPFGFAVTENGYCYSAALLDGQFEMTVNITCDGIVSTEVVDNGTEDAYVLHRVPDAVGEFVGNVRKEYERVLERISEKCFESDAFKSEHTKQVIQYVYEQYNDEPQFLWERTPNNAVLRRKDNTKWYAALLLVQRQRLGLSGEGAVEVIDLKIKPEEIGTLVDGKVYLPGYHMNKKHWYTICLDGSVSVEEICRRIDESYILAKH